MMRTTTPVILGLFLALAGCVADVDVVSTDPGTKASAAAEKTPTLITSGEGLLIPPLELGPYARAGGKGTKCVNVPVVSVTPDPVPAGPSSISISGTGFCTVGAVFVDVKEFFTCYPGSYVYSGTFSVGYPPTINGVTETVTFVAGQTYTAEVYEAINTNGVWSVGNLLATGSFTSQ
jgi:hypothetical protein